MTTTQSGSVEQIPAEAVAHNCETAEPMSNVADTVRKFQSLVEHATIQLNALVP